MDAYDDPNAASDLAAFSQQFGLSAAKFDVVYAQGSAPPVDSTGGWQLEKSLDIEYAHAVAPQAKLYLVEANSDYDSDLFPAVLVASNLVECGSPNPCPKGSHGKGEVPISWGGEGFDGETALDSFFTSPNVVYFAASGDSAGVIYPCASPNAICAGGTSTARNENSGNLIAEIAWSDAGGGISSYEPIPRYQALNPGLASQLQGYRGVPDISADANPNTGAWVLDDFPYELPGGSETGWFIVGGASLATPLSAGIFNATSSFGYLSFSELWGLYSPRNPSSFRDITYGACGIYSGSFSQPGWDFALGWAAPPTSILAESSLFRPRVGDDFLGAEDFAVPFFALFLKLDATFVLACQARALMCLEFLPVLGLAWIGSVRLYNPNMSRATSFAADAVIARPIPRTSYEVYL